MLTTHRHRWTRSSGSRLILPRIDEAVERRPADFIECQYAVKSLHMHPQGLQIDCGKLPTQRFLVAQEVPPRSPREYRAYIIGRPLGGHPSYENKKRGSRQPREPRFFWANVLAGAGARGRRSMPSGGPYPVPRSRSRRRFACVAADASPWPKGPSVKPA